MRLSVLLFTSALAMAQSAVTTFTTDLNGNRIASAVSSTVDHTQTQLSQSINGKQVPLEQREQRVLRKDSSGTVTETVVRKYDPNGQLSSTERVVTEEHPTYGGGSSVRATTYRSDVNGREQEVERRSTDTRIQGKTTSTDTAIARPSLSGSFETAEKRSAVTTEAGASTTTTESVYRADLNGSLSEAQRSVTQQTQTKGQTVINIANYEQGSTGALQLHDQSVSTTVTQPDGSATTQIDLYGAFAYGVVQDANAKQQIREEQIITHKKLPDGSIAEVVSVRRPSISDPNHLGSPEKISEIVCQGQCDTPATPATPASLQPGTPVKK